jgi:hypothetical protein
MPFLVSREFLHHRFWASFLRTAFITNIKFLHQRSSLWGVGDRHTIRSTHFVWLKLSDATIIQLMTRNKPGHLQWRIKLVTSGLKTKQRNLTLEQLRHSIHFIASTRHCYPFPSGLPAGSEGYWCTGPWDRAQRSTLVCSWLTLCCGIESIQNKPGERYAVKVKQNTHG